MTDAERLLDLTVEYQEATASRSPDYAGMGTPTGREPAVIAEEYQAVLLGLVAVRPGEAPRA